MRVATYSPYSSITQASVLAVLLFALTVVQGTSTSLVLMQYFVPNLQALETLLWLGCYAVALTGLMFRHGISWIFWLSRYRFLLIVLLLGTIASVTWSIDSGVSLQRTVHLIGSCILAIYFGFMLPLSTLLSVLSGVLAIILLASIGAVFLLPDLGIEAYEGSRVWRGITTSKNTLGFWAAIGVLLYISQMARPISLARKAAYLVLTLVSLATLYFSHSATSLLALLVGGSLSLYFFLSIRFRLGFFRMGLMAIFFIAVLGLAVANINTAELVGRSGDLTGRGEVWAQTWKLILQKPLTGYGYGSIWNPNDATIWIQQSLTDFSWVVYHAHNGFLQIASEIGLPLSAIALLMIVQQLIEIFYCQYQRQQTGVLFVLGFATAYLVSNYSEARFLVNRELYWILFIALPISMLRQINVVLTDPAVQDDAGHNGFTPHSEDPPGNQPAPSWSTGVGTAEAVSDFSQMNIPAIAHTTSAPGGSQQQFPESAADDSADGNTKNEEPQPDVDPESFGENFLDADLGVFEEEPAADADRADNGDELFAPFDPDSDLDPGRDRFDKDLGLDISLGEVPEPPGAKPRINKPRRN
ncbi:MAG: O-antigen ligase family protein [Gammaproteobacteria bacterium]|nr:O-antigen ligase family protein [Gammaproteobacteria bacterium]